MGTKSDFEKIKPNSTNFAQDNDALTSSDTENNFPIKFQPMPKRFMVWDKREHRFCREALPDNEHNAVFDIWDMTWWLDTDCPKDFIICQSTNLFDQDGEEVFEGHILDNGTCRAICEWDNSNAEFDFKMTKGNDSVKGCLDDYKIIGHALSNPELLEEE